MSELMNLILESKDRLDADASTRKSLLAEMRAVIKKSYDKFDNLVSDYTYSKESNYELSIAAKEFLTDAFRYVCITENIEFEIVDSYEALYSKIYHLKDMKKMADAVSQTTDYEEAAALSYGDVITDNGWYRLCDSYYQFLKSLYE